MDPRKIRVLFNRRRRIHRVGVFIFISCCTLLVAGLVSTLAMDDAVDRAAITENRNSVPRLFRMEQKQKTVMISAGAILVTLIAASGTLLLISWRCPQCNTFLALEFSPNYCPRCGADFCGENRNSGGQTKGC